MNREILDGVLFGLGIGATVIVPFVLGYYAGHSRGVDSQIRAHEADRRTTSGMFRDLGLCEWPKAYAKAQGCPDE